MYGGVSTTGTLLADGAVDPHYQLVSSADPSYPGPNAVVVNSGVFPMPPWLANGGSSKWLAPRADQNGSHPPGTYTYRTTFNLTGFNWRFLRNRSVFLSESDHCSCFVDQPLRSEATLAS